MRRADRLFHIIQLIRGRRLTTAAWLAGRLEVSERTIYRDVADLQAQGVPLEGEAGVGYRLGAGFDLPPMMFTQDEAKALVASVRLSQVWLDAALGQSAQDALGKILSVLPAEARVAAEALAVFAPEGGLPRAAQRTQVETRGVDGSDEFTLDRQWLVVELARQQLGRQRRPDHASRRKA